MESEMNMDQDILEDLSDEELQALEDAAVEKRIKDEERRNMLASILTKDRDAAVTFRQTSGIEMQWAEDQAYYEGADDSARTEYYKGLTAGTPLITKTKPKYKSRVFLNITRPYVETASSKVIEVLNPTDARPWSLEPSSVPELPEKPTPLVQALQMNEQGGQPQVDPVEEMIKAAKRSALGAQTWIDDKLQECDFSGQLRAVVDEASRLGTGIIRGPVPEARRSVKVERDPNTGEEKITILEGISPGSRMVSCWNAFPDPACGDNIHNGQFFIERDLMVEKQVRDLIGQPGYDNDALAKVIEEGPRTNASSMMAMAPHDSLDPKAQRFNVWYYYGFLTLQDARLLNCDCAPEDEIKNVGVPIIVTIINDTPVKAHLNPIISGRFPYDFMCWQRVAGSPFGIGIARQIRSCQSILNAHVRAMNENAGLSSGPQIVIARGSVTPADGSWEITPRKIWLLKADADITDVNQALNAFQIPSQQSELLAAIDFALKMAENVTGLPVLLQGQQGPNGVPETVGGMQILVANASSLLRRMARVFDDHLIKPHITAYYDYMMVYGEDDSVKGDFKVVAHGSTALVTRDQRNQFVTQVAPQLMANPAFGIDPTRLFKKIAEVAGMSDPESIQFTPTELAAIQKAQAESASVDPRVIAAQVTGQTRVKVAEMVNETDRFRVQRDIDRDTKYVQAESERTQITAETRMAEMQMRRELALLEYANREKISLNQLKMQLAIESGRNDLARELATLPTTKEVAEGIRAGNQVKAGGVAGNVEEVPGQAPPGMGFAL